MTWSITHKYSGTVFSVSIPGWRLLKSLLPKKLQKLLYCPCVQLFEIDSSSFQISVELERFKHNSTHSPGLREARRRELMAPSGLLGVHVWREEYADTVDTVTRKPARAILTAGNGPQSGGVALGLWVWGQLWSQQLLPSIRIMFLKG